MVSFLPPSSSSIAKIGFASRQQKIDFILFVEWKECGSGCKIKFSSDTFPTNSLSALFFKEGRSQPIYLFNTVDNVDAEGAIVTFPPIVSIPTIFGLFYP